VVGANLYILSINLYSLLKESNFLLIGALISSAPTSINTTRKAVDLIDIDINIKDLIILPLLNSGFIQGLKDQSILKGSQFNLLLFLFH
jgi:hypothetical protein